MIKTINNKQFNLSEFKKKIGIDKYEEHNHIINARVKEIRTRIMKAERIKSMTIENYLIDAYTIETIPPIRLLKKYNLIDEYYINEYESNFLTLK